MRTEEEFRQQIVDTARSYIGVGWKGKGRHRAEGMDCGGVAIAVGREVGAFPWTYDFTAYAEAVKAGAHGPWPGSTKVPNEEMAPGDLILLSHPVRKKEIFHIGVIGGLEGELTLIHMSVKRGLDVREEPLAGFVERRNVWVYRFDYPPKEGWR